MKVVKTIEELKKHIRDCKKTRKEIGFVPTMGYLHEGHLSLIKYAASENDFVVVSIFVNPTQFGPKEDYAEYPRDLERDISLAEKAGAHMIFAPATSEMYPKGYATFVEVERLTENLCGGSRPGFFRGIATVVTKLFHLVEPNRAYFGQKDAQQAIVIQRMVRDLNMNIEICACPIIRESDGLAMSSRNVYLSSEERHQALSLSQSLFCAKELILNGERDKQIILSDIHQKIASQPLAEIDYIEMVDSENLKEVEQVCGRILIALAVWFGKTRLIDNIFVEV